MGQREAFSSDDVEKLNNMYKCGNVAQTVPIAAENVNDKEILLETTTQSSFFNLLGNWGNLVNAALSSGK